MTDAPTLFGSEGFKALLDAIGLRAPNVPASVPEKTPEMITFGKRLTPPVQKDISLKVVRLEILRFELCSLFEDPDFPSKTTPFVLVTAPVPLLKIGNLAVVMIDPENGLYSFRENGSATNVMVTASEERLLDIIVSHLAAGADCLTPFTPSVMARMLVGQRLEDVERHLVLQTLRQFHGNRVRAAEVLGLTSLELRRRLRAYLGVQSSGAQT